MWQWALGKATARASLLGMELSQPSHLVVPEVHVLLMQMRTESGNWQGDVIPQHGPCSIRSAQRNDDSCMNMSTCQDAAGSSTTSYGVCVSHMCVTNMHCRAQSAMQSHIINLQTSPAVQATRLLNPGRRGPAAAISNGTSVQKAACVPCIEQHVDWGPTRSQQLVPHMGRHTCTASWRQVGAAVKQHLWAQCMQHDGKFSSSSWHDHLRPCVHAAAAAPLVLPHECRLHPQPPCKPQQCQ